MSVEFGRDTFGSELFGAPAPAAIPEVSPPAGTYLFELRDEDDTVLCWLPFWFDATWIQSANEPSGLTFSYPYTDGNASLITFPNVVRLYNSDGVILDKFRVFRRESRHGASGELILDVECEGLLGQLGPMAGLINYGARNARQSVTLGGSPTGGTFTLTYAGSTTTAIAYDARCVDIEELLEPLASIGANNVHVTGDAGGPWEVQFQGSIGGQIIALMTADAAGLEGAGDQTVTIAETVAGRAASATVGGIVADLLSLQTGDLPHIKLGPIDASIGAIAVGDFQLENGRILEGIRKLHDLAGGWFEVDEFRRFTWSTLSGSWTGQQIRFDTHMRALSVSYDYSRIRTRVTVIGEGIETGARIEATVTAGAPVLALYGTIDEIVVNKNIWNLQQAEDYAQELVDRLSTPEKIVNVDAIDLSKADCSRLDWSHAALTLGTRVRLVDADLAEEIDTTIVKISRNLSKPTDVTIEVSDTRRQSDLLDTIARMEEGLSEITSRDWGISQSIRELNLDDGTTFPEISRVFTDETEEPEAYKDGDLIFHDDANTEIVERGESSDIVTTRALRQCPEAITETEVTPSSATLTVAAPGQTKLFKDADCPAWLRIFKPGDYAINETIPISAVADRTFTIATGINCIQGIRLGLATGGTFTLTYDGQTTGAIAWDASAATVDAAIEALSNIGAGDVAVERISNGWNVTFQGALAETDTPLMTADGTNLTGDTEIETFIVRAGGPFDIERIWPVGSYLKRQTTAEPSVCSLLTEGNVNDGGLQKITNALDRCPDATLLAAITAAGASFTVSADDVARLPANAECPLEVKLYNATALEGDPDYNVYELVAVSAVVAGTGTYTISARGEGDSTAANWAAGTGIKVTKKSAAEVPATTVCDILTGAQINDKDDVIQPVGAVCAAGDTGLLADAGHVHEGAVTGFGDDIQSVGTENSEGDGTLAAREDHVHAGTNIWVAYGGA